MPSVKGLHELKSITVQSDQRITEYP